MNFESRLKACALCKDVLLRIEDIVDVKIGMIRANCFRQFFSPASRFLR